MKQTTFAYIFDNNSRILLCMKKRGFGEGKWNGPGGKVNPNESIIDGARRELHEETGIDLPIEKLEFKGILHFYYEGKPEWDQDINTFVHRGYSGDFYETEEMLPKWYEIYEIPYDEMWIDDKIWLPVLIAGEEFEFTFVFSEDGNIKEWQRHL